MAKYGKAASKSVASAVRRQKTGTLKSGSGRTVRSRKQAVAIGLSEARRKGAKVPPPKDASASRPAKAGRSGARARQTTSRRSTRGRASK